MTDRTAPLVVTLALDAASFARLDALRQVHFPPERNFLPAHLTLFHALPGEQFEAVCDGLRAACDATPPPPLTFPQVRSLGRGVAVEVNSPQLLAVRSRLAAEWGVWLTPQDRQPFRPHVTVQNKVMPAEAKELHARLAAGWLPLAGTGVGVLLWRYAGGPWEAAGEFPFAAGEKLDPPTPPGR